MIHRLNGMTASIKAALAGPNKARVQTLFVSVSGLIKNKDFAQAGAALDELEPLVAAPSTAPPAPAAQTPSAGAAVIKRLNAMSADIKAALGGPNKARVQALFGAVNGSIKKNDYVQAVKELDELALLLTKAAVPAPPAAAPPVTAPPPAGKTPVDDAALQAEWERRVTALEPQVLAAQKTRAGEAKWMTMFMTVQDLGSDGDFAKALAVLDRLEGMLNAPTAGSAKNPGLETALAEVDLGPRRGGRELLQALEGHIRAMNDPDGDGAIILVKAIQANLTPRPETAEAVAELERYIETDQIITDAEGPELGFGASRS